jgi:hypothetical protein
VVLEVGHPSWTCFVENGGERGNRLRLMAKYKVGFRAIELYMIEAHVGELLSPGEHHGGHKGACVSHMASAHLPLIDSRAANKEPQVPIVTSPGKSSS